MRRCERHCYVESATWRGVYMFIRLSAARSLRRKCKCRDHWRTQRGARRECFLLIVSAISEMSPAGDRIMDRESLRHSRSIGGRQTTSGPHPRNPCVVLATSNVSPPVMKDAIDIETLVRTPLEMRTKRNNRFFNKTRDQTRKRANLSVNFPYRVLVNSRVRSVFQTSQTHTHQLHFSAPDRNPSRETVRPAQFCAREARPSCLFRKRSGLSWWPVKAPSRLGGRQPLETGLLPALAQIKGSRLFEHEEEEICARAHAPMRHSRRATDTRIPWDLMEQCTPSRESVQNLSREQCIPLQETVTDARPNNWHRKLYFTSWCIHRQGRRTSTVRTCAALLETSIF